MSKSMYATGAVLAASLLLAACGSSSKSSSSSSATSAAPAATTSGSAATVKSVSNSTVGGTILVDSSGMTLYRLSGESAGKFICTSQACVAVWHPLKAGAAAPSGSGSLGTVKRPDGSEQVTYEGGPLYTFASDTAPGQTKGQGIKDVGTWSVVKVAGGAGSAPTPAPAPSESSGSGGGGSYAY